MIRLANIAAAVVGLPLLALAVGVFREVAREADQVELLIGGM